MSGNFHFLISTVDKLPARPILPVVLCANAYFVSRPRDDSLYLDAAQLNVSLGELPVRQLHVCLPALLLLMCTFAVVNICEQIVVDIKHVFTTQFRHRFDFTSFYRVPKHVLY